MLVRASSVELRNPRHGVCSLWRMAKVVEMRMEFYIWDADKQDWDCTGHSMYALMEQRLWKSRGVATLTVKERKYDGRNLQPLPQECRVRP